ncbi:Clp protease ClpP [Azotobacter chroococcum subsp. isscasi]|uniref:head maturation protease, ClpP-related n=1 Tax=Azotobacter chroococcum TaxID=353 RepID=UPI00103B89BA|nr:head maturation protease, ClpP-related [Azotobacter chroococcum]TBW12653.1 Clp protease ClpP [Azotobacter chroococcum subsp. isscasi]
MNHPRQQPRILNQGPGGAGPQGQHWYRIQAAGEGEQRSIEVYIYGEIGGWGITAAQFIQALKEADDGNSPVVARFNTIGGDLFDGIAIHNTLQRLGERATASIEGACYSSGTVAATGAHRVTMADNALFMIHNPWTWAAGDSEELRKLADMLDQALEGIVASYQHRPLTIDDAELRRLIDAETWLTAAEAKALGFVDEVSAGGSVKACIGQSRILNRYQHPPKELLAQQDEPPVPEPDPASEPDPAPQPEPDAAALAAELAAGCQQAGIADLTEVLIKASGLKSRAAIQAELARAKAVRELCNAARLPDEARGLITAGLDAEGARAKLFDKLVGSGLGEIDNTPPAPDPTPTGVKAVDPGAIYARRNQRASKGAHK